MNEHSKAQHDQFLNEKEKKWKEVSKLMKLALYYTLLHKDFKITLVSQLLLVKL